MRNSVVNWWDWLVPVLFMVAGANHFMMCGRYLSMMPAWLPWPLLLVQVSGVAEIVGGIGLLIPRGRRMAAWGLLALLMAVFPANLNVALHGWPGMTLSPYLLWLRLPFQLVFVWSLYRIYLGPRSPVAASAETRPYS